MIDHTAGLSVGQAHEFTALEPPPLKIHLLKPHGKKQPGHVFSHDYHEAVALINAGVAEQAR